MNKMALVLLAASPTLYSCCCSLLSSIILAAALHGVGSSSNSLELHNEASNETNARIGLPQRLTLRHLESMWHTSLGKELDSSSTGREEAFREMLDAEWAFLQPLQHKLHIRDKDARHIPLPTKTDPDLPETVEFSHHDETSMSVNNEDTAAPAEAVRSPFLVCTNRHPDALRPVENRLHRVRTQLAYSRENTACLLTGLHLVDVDAVRELAGVHFVEPLPHLAKLSRSLRVEFEPVKAPAEEKVDSVFSESHKSSASTGDGGVYTGTSGQSATLERSAETERLSGNIRFNHGKGLPGDLEVTLTPGAWGIGMKNRWIEHLIRFGSAANLWEQHLRKAFLWTREREREIELDDSEETVTARRGKGRGETTTNNPPRNIMATKHGLEDSTNVWEQVIYHSSKHGACDFAQLHVQPADGQQRSIPSNKNRNGQQHGRGENRPESQLGGNASGRKRQGEEEAHDRVVLRGVDSLGKEKEDNTYCLMTVMAYLATRPEVAYVTDLPKVVPLNIEAAWILQSGQETTYPMWEQSIDGSTEIIAMADSGLDASSCFFREDDGDNIECSSYSSPVYDLTKRKVVQYVGYVDCYDYQNGHGTHVAGSAAGALSGTSPGEHLGDGLAFGAKLSVFDFGNSEGGLVTPSNLQTQMLTPPYDIGARVSTNSWGAVRTSYTSLDMHMDDFAYSNTDMVILIAAGNCGDSISECEYLGVDIYGAGSILSPALAKNVISVGASEASPNSAGLADDINEVAYFSSQGPTFDDNRIKPDVVAPGYHLFSAQANPDDGETCAIGSMAGTSMATPVVAGSVALIRQYFVQGWYPTGQASPSDMFNPSNALVKAMVVASGTGMAAYDGIDTYTTLRSPPDGIQGFGRVLLDSVLNVRGTVSLYVEDAITIKHDVVHSYIIDMSDIDSSEYEGDMKVVMVWMEPAAMSGSAAPVFNDLDLQVVAYDGSTNEIFYPNNLATKDYDNTVEMITISDVDSYLWFNVTVTGASVVTSSLPYYALVVTGGKAGDYSPASSTGRSWFVQWKMTIKGIPVEQAATVAFEAALAEAISAETGNYTSDNATVLVQIDESTLSTSGGGGGSSSSSSSSSSTPNRCTITVEISVKSESYGYAVLTYVVETVEGSPISSDQGLTSVLNDALSSRTTDGCECVISFDGTQTVYDCSSCEEGEAFQSVQLVIAHEGDYGLFSTEGDGHSPTSVFSVAHDDSAGNPGLAQLLKGVLRTEQWTHVLALVVSVVAFTALCGLLVRYYYNAEDEVDSSGSGLSTDFGRNYTPTSKTLLGSTGGGSKTPLEKTPSRGRTLERDTTREHRISGARGIGLEVNRVSTPESPGRPTWGEAGWGSNASPAATAVGTPPVVPQTSV